MLRYLHLVLETALNKSHENAAKLEEMEFSDIKRDANDEILSVTKEKFTRASAFAHELAGKMSAMVEFVNAAQAAGYRIKSE